MLPALPTSPPAGPSEGWSSPRSVIVDEHPQPVFPQIYAAGVCIAILPQHKTPVPPQMGNLSSSHVVSGQKKKRGGMMPPSFYTSPLDKRLEEDRLDTALPPSTQIQFMNNQSKSAYLNSIAVLNRCLGRHMTRPSANIKGGTANPGHPGGVECHLSGGHGDKGPPSWPCPRSRRVTSPGQESQEVGPPGQDSVREVFPVTRCRWTTPNPSMKTDAQIPASTRPGNPRAAGAKKAPFTGAFIFLLCFNIFAIKGSGVYLRLPYRLPCRLFITSGRSSVEQLHQVMTHAGPRRRHLCREQTSRRLFSAATRHPAKWNPLFPLFTL